MRGSFLPQPFAFQTSCRQALCPDAAIEHRDGWWAMAQITVRALGLLAKTARVPSRRRRHCRTSIQSAIAMARTGARSLKTGGLATGIGRRVDRSAHGDLKSLPLIAAFSRLRARARWERTAPTESPITAATSS